MEQKQRVVEFIKMHKRKIINQLKVDRKINYNNKNSSNLTKKKCSENIEETCAVEAKAAAAKKIKRKYICATLFPSIWIIFIYFSLQIQFGYTHVTINNNHNNDNEHQINKRK